MVRTEADLIPNGTDVADPGFVTSQFEQPVYQSTIQMPIRPPTGRLSNMFTNKTYNKILSTICFTLFIIGFLWSMFNTGKINHKNFKSYSDLLFFTSGTKPICERMSWEQISMFSKYLKNATTCPASVGDPLWPDCERAIPFTADIFVCCENDQFKSLKIGSIDLNYKNALFLMEALKRGF